MTAKEQITKRCRSCNHVRPHYTRKGGGAMHECIDCDKKHATAWQCAKRARKLDDNTLHVRLEYAKIKVAAYEEEIRRRTSLGERG